jgi:lipid-A-disaccharide synthase
MKPKTFMLIAIEPSGDQLAAELVHALRDQFAAGEPILTPDYQPLYTSLEPRFFGAGGPQMAKAGVELAFDMTAHSVIGSDFLKHYFEFRRVFQDLCKLALDREPDAIICVDSFLFNGLFAREIKEYVQAHSDWFHTWNPKIIQYVSPQVWASRERRAYQLARDFDVLLSIFPFEKQWYARRVPRLRVDFVGHPIADRHSARNGVPSLQQISSSAPLLLLLPGSRRKELTRHLPVMLGALSIIRASIPDLRARMVLPSESLLQQAKDFGLPAGVEVQCGGLPESLQEARAAIASTGTVTLECACFGVPTVALYKASWTTFQIGKRIVKVKYLAMPNLLANEEVFPEFIQNAATAENIARAGLELLRDEPRRARIKAKLSEIVKSLGSAGASQRAASAILGLLPLGAGRNSEAKT